MEINIIKKEDGEIIFKFDEEENKFEYENFDKLIERVYDNDITINYNSPDDLKEYEELIKGIVEGSRTDDYREAVRKAKETSENLKNEEEKNIDE